MPEFQPADLVDYVSMFPDAGGRLWRAARVQILAGPAWTLWRDGSRLAICGLFPLHSGILEAWLMIPRGARPTLSTLRFLLDRAATVMPEQIIITRVDDDNRAGQRLALLAGFVPIDEWLRYTRVRTWVRPGVKP